LNVFNNAFDAIEGLPERWIRVEAIIENNYIKLLLTDSGSGIPEEDQKKTIQAFFTTKAVGNGTGLGLSGGNFTYNPDSKNT